MLEYLSILVLLISEEKRSARRLACATKDDPIFTSEIVTFYQSAAKESEQTGCENRKIGKRLYCPREFVANRLCLAVASSVLRRITADSARRRAFRCNCSCSCCISSA